LIIVVALTVMIVNWFSGESGRHVSQLDSLSEAAGQSPATVLKGSGHRETQQYDSQDIDHTQPREPDPPCWNTTLRIFLGVAHVCTIA
jgi:hypothetical protein